MNLPSNAVVLSSDEMMYLNGGGWSARTFVKSAKNLIARLPKPMGVLIKGLAVAGRTLWYYIGQIALYSTKIYAVLGGIACFLLAGAYAAAIWMGNGVRFK